MTLFGLVIVNSGTYKWKEGAGGGGGFKGMLIPYPSIFFKVY